MEQLWEVLDQQSRALLLPLILSHASFSQTVENIFALAFLVRRPRLTVSLAAHSASPGWGLCVLTCQPAGARRQGDAAGLARGGGCGGQER